MKKVYLAKIIFQIEIENGRNLQQFDEQFRIFHAFTPGEAISKAKELGSQEEESFINSNNNLVKWKFIAVSDLIQINEIKDGELLYSYTHETENSHNFKQIVIQKSLGLEMFSSITF